MAFNINEFNASISKLGVQRASHYAVNISAPPGLSTSGVLTDLPIRINSINLPGTTLGMDDIKFSGFGLSERRPNAVTYEDITMTIIADANGRILDFLHEWMELVFPTSVERNGSDSVEYFEYPNNYYGGLELYVYDPSGNKHTTYTFKHPFISALGSVSMGWENTDSVMIIPVSFTYRSFEKNSSSEGAVVMMPNAQAPIF